MGKRRQSSKTWAVSAYFNPAGYESKRQNFLAFRRHLEIPLLVVEFSRNGAFELSDTDCDKLVQLSRGDVLWQKEALLNAGISHLEDICENVVFLDADVIFSNPDWVTELEELLEEKTLVQPFESVIDLDRGDTSEIRKTGATSPRMFSPRDVSGVRHELDGFRIGFAKAWLEGMLPRGYFTSRESRNRPPTAPGFALAAKKTFFERNGIYDRGIIGGGDTLLWAAAIGEKSFVVNCLKLAGNYREDYLKWATRFHNAIQDQIGYVPVQLLHLRHGDLENRQYYIRAGQLRDLKYDPDQDLNRSPDGLWELREERYDLQAFAKKYFAKRLEDH